MKQGEQPNYYAILTADVRYSKELNFFEKVLYADITALTNKYGYCSATNGYFSQLFGKTKGTISKAISKFEKLGFLQVVINRDETTKQIIDRKLYLKTTIPIVENNHRGIAENNHTPIVENNQENITSNNITSNKKRNIKEKIEIDENKICIEAWEAWLEYKGKNYTLQQQKLALKKLQSLTKQEQKEAVENSILSGYKGLYTPHTSSSQKGKTVKKGLQQKNKEFVDNLFFRKDVIDVDIVQGGVV